MDDQSTRDDGAGTDPVDKPVPPAPATGITVSRGLALGVVGGALAAAGTLLPWLSVNVGLLSATRTGVEISSDALFILGLGVVGALLVLTGNRTAFAMTAVGGLAIGYIAWQAYGQLVLRTLDRSILASIGPGLYLCFIGAALMIVAGLIGPPKRT